MGVGGEVAPFLGGEAIDLGISNCNQQGLSFQAPGETHGWLLTKLCARKDSCGWTKSPTNARDH